MLQLNSASGPALAGNLTVSGGTAVWLQNSQVNDAANLTVSSGLANIGPYSKTVNNVQITGGTIAGTTGVLTSTNASGRPQRHDQRHPRRRGGPDQVHHFGHGRPRRGQYL